MNYKIKAGVTSNPLNLSLTESDGTASDLTDSDTLVLRVGFADGTVDEFDLEIVGAATLGTCRRIWLPGETDVVGVHTAEVIMTDTDGNESIWPREGYFYLLYSSPIPRLTPASFEWGDVVGLDADIADISDSAVELIMALTYEKVNVSSFGGETSPTLKYARILFAAHLGRVTLESANVSGPLSSRSEGGVSESFSPMSYGASDLNTTKWGTEFRALARGSIARVPIIV